MHQKAFQEMNGRELRAMRQALREENALWPERMREVPAADWPSGLRARVLELAGASMAKAPRRAWRSRRFAALLYDEGHGKPMRLTVNRTSIDDTGRFVDGVTWDELMQVKRECGFGDVDAVELYPADSDVVDVQNMRHLWLLDEPSPLTWRERVTKEAAMADDVTKDVQDQPPTDPGADETNKTGTDESTGESAPAPAGQ